jgi:hypothetical protein
VQVLADGAPVADATVSGGKITLTTAASVVQVGYSYNSDLKTLRADPTIAGTSSSQGMMGRIDNILLRFYRTVGGKYGPDSNTLSPIVYRDPFDPMDTPVPFFSGDVKLPMDLGRDRKRQIFVRQDQPLPFNLLSMIQLGNAGDR